MEPKLQRLITQLADQLAELTQQLLDGTLDAARWQTESERILSSHHFAAFLLGRGGNVAHQLDRMAMSTVEQLIDDQVGYLDGLVKDIRSGRYAEAPGALTARVGMYARAISPTFWTARTWGLPLPAMPGEGTQCLTNCRCGWEIVTVDADKRDYDCYWRLGAAEHCQTCNQRAVDWNPIQIRDGVLL